MGKHHRNKKSKQDNAAGLAVSDMKPSEIAIENAAKQKKRKRQDMEAGKDPVEALETPPAPIVDASRKKRKKKKKQKKAKSSCVEGDESLSFSEKESSPLEGSMVGDQMVLLDRSIGIVFSALDRNEDGSLKQVGTIGKGGQINLLTRDPSGVVEIDRTTDRGSKEEDKAKFAFDTDPDDHCESPLQAYQDIVPFLKSFGKEKSPSELRIYDPYYCNGGVRENLKSLGFPNVYNQNEDCYEVWRTPSRYPSFDIFITNPPYSADHMEKLMKHITSPAFGTRPWMLLLPQFVHKKDYYLKATEQIQPFYVVPKKRYVYLPPPSFRQAKKSDVHKKSSPFVSMWYIWGGTRAQNDRWLDVARRSCSSTCDVARSKSALRDLRRAGKR